MPEQENNIPLILNKSHTFDLIFSLGEACSCSSALREYHLQVYSYPFDWLFGSDFLGRCGILANHFDRFIEKDDLEYSYEEKNINCMAYHNKHNDITFNHDFLKEIPFENAYQQVKGKYDRRINRLLNKINQSNSILVVYMETPITNHHIVSNEKIIKGYSILKESFGDKVSLLYLINDNKKNLIEFLENNKIIKVSKDYKEYNSNVDYAVNLKSLKDVFSGYKLNLSLGYVIRKKITKFLINFIPIKSMRKTLRKKLHIIN